MKTSHIRQRLLASTTRLGAIAMLSLAAPTLALAQTAPPAGDVSATPETAADATTTTGGRASTATVGEVVVTGSIIRRRNVNSASPLTVVTDNDLDVRGITTVQSAIQLLSSNGAGALPNAFTANGAFAAGASGASLRGLTTNSTLVLIDGVRAAYYPLADDGSRNFVDLNTIPRVVVDRIDVLQSGASSTYGADAIAGVVNIITKRSFNGVELTAEGGLSQKGDADSKYFSGIVGHGDLNRDGFNVYLGGEYSTDSSLYARDRGFPYNTANRSTLCAPSIGSATIAAGTTTCQQNFVQNGIQANGTFLGVGTTNVALVRPFNAANTTAAGNYQLISPTVGCGTLTPVTLTAAQGTVAGAPAGTVLCQQDLVRDYRMILPENERFSVTGHLTKKFGDSAEFYVEGNYYQNETTSTGTPQPLRAVTPPSATTATFSTANLALPIYVCPTGVNCSAANGTLNPNNPFAAAGQVARIFYRFGDIPVSNNYVSQTYRVATGLKGSFDGGWRYSVDLTGMQTDLTATRKGYLFVANLLNAVATGSYNFVNPGQNTQAVRDFLSPTSVQSSSSQLAMIQGNISKELFELPGGPLTLGIGAASRYESVYNPSANGDATSPERRYTTINAFGTIGERNVQSAYFEVAAPILKQLDVNFSGRFDTYSSGQDNFSPKVEVLFKPIDMFTLRGTFSEGFRIPSFAEANSLPTTGYITVNAPASFQAAHGNNTYGQSYSLGLTQVGTAGLEPETAENITAGFVFEPIRRLSFSVDYFRIEKTGVIAGADYTPAVNAYYAGQATPAGFTVIADTPDPSFPNALPRLAFVQYGYANLNSQITEGFDFAATARLDLPYGVKWTSVASATYVDRLDNVFPDGTVQRYAGTLGPYQITSASGTPQWRGNWQNTFDFGKASLTATVYYTDGYEETAEDNGATKGDCNEGVSHGTPAGYRDGVTPILCNVDPFVNVDLHGSYQLTNKFQVYFDVANLFDADAPEDPTTYGSGSSPGGYYNPAWATSGIIGRYFKVGLKATF